MVNLKQITKAQLQTAIHKRAQVPIKAIKISKYRGQFTVQIPLSCFSDRKKPYLVKVTLTPAKHDKIRLTSKHFKTRARGYKKLDDLACTVLDAVVCAINALYQRDCRNTQQAFKHAIKPSKHEASCLKYYAYLPSIDELISHCRKAVAQPGMSLDDRRRILNNAANIFVTILSYGTDKQDERLETQFNRQKAAGDVPRATPRGIFILMSVYYGRAVRFAKKSLLALAKLGAKGEYDAGYAHDLTEEYQVNPIMGILLTDVLEKDTGTKDIRRFLVVLQHDPGAYLTSWALANQLCMRLLSDEIPLVKAAIQMASES